MAITSEQWGTSVLEAARDYEREMAFQRDMAMRQQIQQADMMNSPYRQLGGGGQAIPQAGVAYGGSGGAGNRVGSGSEVRYYPNPTEAMAQQAQAPETDKRLLLLR